MKDEIKEILEQYLDSIISYPFQKKDKEYILDYITNLQEENEKNKEYSEFYKDMSDKWKELSGVFKKSCEDYKTRNEKAIEYINENKHLSMFADCREPEEDWNYDLEIDPRDLLNILQGKSDE